MKMSPKEEWAILPFNTKRLGSSYLVTNNLGSWSFLSNDEYRKFNTFSLDKKSPLFQRLLKAGMIFTKENANDLFLGYRRANRSLFTDATLHIAVITTRCNLSCKYCQTKTQKTQDMTIDVASRILDFIGSIKSRPLVLEFQGGEPILNWKVFSFLAKNARELIPDENQLVLALVSNLSLLDKNKIDFIAKNNIRVCTSLDGPKKIHDKNRVFMSNEGSYDKVIDGIKKLNAAYKKLDKPACVDLLPTITKPALPYYKDIIDEYVRLRQSYIALRPVRKIGVAEESWEDVGYEPEEFNDFWARAMDYILYLNKRGTMIQERIASILLSKIAKNDPAYVDLTSPCGAGRSVLTYMPDGSIYPCDEARMVKQKEMFKLGNVLKDKYCDLIKNNTLFSVCGASVMQLWDYASAYLPWKSTCPVLNYCENGNLIPHLKATTKDKILDFQLDYIFNILKQDKEEAAILKGW